MYLFARQSDWDSSGSIIPCIKKRNFLWRGGVILSRDTYGFSYWLHWTRFITRLSATHFESISFRSSRHKFIAVSVLFQLFTSPSDCWSSSDFSLQWRNMSKVSKIPFTKIFRVDGELGSKWHFRVEIVKILTRLKRSGNFLHKNLSGGKGWGRAQNGIFE